MKILYTISTLNGLGADKWIHDGYKRAFEADGHKFYTLTKGGNLQEAIRGIDILLLDYAWFIQNKPALWDKGKTKILCQIGSCLDKETFGERELETLKLFLPLFDELWTWNAPEVYTELENKLQKKIHFVPHAADSSVYYPDKESPKFACDIAFVGSKYTAKPFFTKELVPALKKRYKIRIYGPGWSLGDRILRIAQKLARNLGKEEIANFINKRRLGISQDDERRLYSSAKICLNFHEYYKDGTPKNFEVERTFKIPACGGFQITDYSLGMERYFGISKEIKIANNKTEWLGLIDYYLRLEEPVKKWIQAAGTERVLKEHTYKHRVKQLLEL